MKYMIEGRNQRGERAVWNKVQGFVAPDDDSAKAYLKRLQQENRLHRVFKRYRLVRI